MLFKMAFRNILRNGRRALGHDAAGDRPAGGSRPPARRAARRPGNRRARSSWSTTARSLPVGRGRAWTSCGTGAREALRRPATPGCGWRPRRSWRSSTPTACPRPGWLGPAAAAPRRPPAGRGGAADRRARRRGDGLARPVRGGGQRARHGARPRAGPAAVGGVLRAERGAAGPPRGARGRLRRDDAGRRGRRPRLAAGRGRLAGALRARGAGGPRAPGTRRRVAAAAGLLRHREPRCWPPGTAARSRPWCWRRSRPWPGRWRSPADGGGGSAAAGVLASTSVRLARRLAGAGERPPLRVRRRPGAPRAGRRRRARWPARPPATTGRSRWPRRWRRAGRGGGLLAVAARRRRARLVAAARPGGTGPFRARPPAGGPRATAPACGRAPCGPGDVRALLPARPPLQSVAHGSGGKRAGAGDDGPRHEPPAAERPVPPVVNPWLALPAGRPGPEHVRRLRAAHERLVTGSRRPGRTRCATSSATSWRRSLGSGVDPDGGAPAGRPAGRRPARLPRGASAGHRHAGDPPAAGRGRRGRPDDRRGHRRRRPDALGRGRPAAAQPGGRHALRRGRPLGRGRRRHQRPRARRSRVDHAVQIYGSEHFRRPVQPWSCSAAPVHDPLTGALLGAIDVTGGDHVASPHVLTLVRATVAAVEAELRWQHREQLQRGTGPARRRRAAAGPAARRPRPRARAADPADRARSSCRSGTPSCSCCSPRPPSRGRAARPRSSPPSATRGDAAAVTVRAELSRLRRLVGAELVGSRPYRLLGRVDTDLDQVRRLLARGAVGAALERYPGAVLPGSHAPGVAVDPRAGVGACSARRCCAAAVRSCCCATRSCRRPGTTSSSGRPASSGCRRAPRAGRPPPPSCSGCAAPHEPAADAPVTPGMTRRRARLGSRE